MSCVFVLRSQLLDECSHTGGIVSSLENTGPLAIYYRIEHLAPSSAL